MGLWEWGAFLNRVKFFGNAKSWFKSKFSKSAPQLLANAKLQNFDLTQYFNQHTAKTNSHRSKDNVQFPFSNTSAPVSLQYGIPFSKNNGLASALQ